MGSKKLFGKVSPLMAVFWGAFSICLLFCLYNLSYVRVIVVTSPNEYHVEKVYIWQSYKGKYGVSIDKVYVDNQSDYPLLLKDYVYQKSNSIIPSSVPYVEPITIRIFPPNSFEMIGGMPDFIMQEPPSVIAVKRKKGDNAPATVRVLEVKRSVHDVFRRDK